MHLITINPAKDAFGHELTGYLDFKWEEHWFLFNTINPTRADVLTEVAHSLEFESGVLGVIKKEDSSYEEQAAFFLQHHHKDIESRSEVFEKVSCFCEPDGYTMYLTNTALTAATIKSIVQKVLAPE